MRVAWCVLFVVCGCSILFVVVCVVFVVCCGRSLLSLVDCDLLCVDVDVVGVACR